MRRRKKNWVSHHHHHHHLDCRLDVDDIPTGTNHKTWFYLVVCVPLISRLVGQRTIQNKVVVVVHYIPKTTREKTTQREKRERELR